MFLTGARICIFGKSVSRTPAGLPLLPLASFHLIHGSTIFWVKPSTLELRHSEKYKQFARLGRTGVDISRCSAELLPRCTRPHCKVLGVPFHHSSQSRAYLQAFREGVTGMN